MSLYYVQKLLYQLNRDPLVRKRFETNRDELLAEYTLSGEERDAILGPPIDMHALGGATRPASSNGQRKAKRRSTNAARKRNRR